MTPYAFAFYLTHWREDLLYPFQVCLQSLETHGGAAAAFPRYLIYSGEITPGVTKFCDQHRLMIQTEPRWTHYFTLPNRTLVCRVPAHNVTCLTDTDVVFVGDPTPMFDQVARTERVHSRVDLSLPFREWPALADGWRAKLYHRVAYRIWRAQFRRFARGTLEVPDLPRPGGGMIPPYFNGGVHFVPGRYLHQLGAAWQYICSTLLRDDRLRRPYTALFQSYYFEQMSYALALWREQIPWSLLPPTYNFMPVEWLPDEERRILESDDIVMVHLVREMRHWLDPQEVAAGQEGFVRLYSRVREVVRETPAR